MLLTEMKKVINITNQKNHKLMPYVSRKVNKKPPRKGRFFYGSIKGMKEPFIVKEEDLKEIAEGVVTTLARSSTGFAKVLLLDGDLGAGKTTFTKVLAEVLGIEKEDVHSPTFILKKEYISKHDFFKKLIHIDAYRFDTPDEARILNLDQDRKDPETLIVIEWPSKMLCEEEDMTISFMVLDDTTREMMINYVSTH
jgi:tRNA threonylcarbamoyladenosine biosynthesis protein TsaE